MCVYMCGCEWMCLCMYMCLLLCMCECVCACVRIYVLSYHVLVHSVISTYSIFSTHHSIFKSTYLRIASCYVTLLLFIFYFILTFV